MEKVKVRLRTTDFDTLIKEEKKKMENEKTRREKVKGLDLFILFLFFFYFFYSLFTSIDPNANGPNNNSRNTTQLNVK